MATIELAYWLFTGALALAGLAMVGAAARAYIATQRTEMLSLSVGFSLVVAAVLATAISGLLSGFSNPQVMFTAQYAVMTVSFAFIIYSILGE